MQVFTYSEARQNLSKLLVLAQTEEVEIRRKDGSIFSLVSTTVRLSKLYLRLHELPEFERFSFMLSRGNQVNHRLTLE